MSAEWRQHLALGLGKLRTSTDAGPVLLGQVQLSAAEARDATALPQHFGFGSNPPAGSDVVFASFGGDRSKTVVLASNHPPTRPRGLPVGGAHLYDAGGLVVEMRNDGIIRLLAPGEVLRHLLTDAAIAVFNAHTHAHGPAPDQNLSSAHLTRSVQAGAAA